MNYDALLYNEIEFDDTRQVINMGGPYIGGLIIKGQLIAEDCVVDNFLIDKTKNRLFFVKYHSLTRFMSGVFFTINCYNVKDQTVSQYRKRFNALHLKDIIGDNLLIHEAFYELDKSKQLFSLAENSILL